MRETLLFVLTLCASTTLASTAFPSLSSTSNSLLSARDTLDCGSGNKACGAVCIPEDYTCCPDESGGCSADEVCQVGDNDKYGCCPVGNLCTGDGGSQFIDEKIGGDDNSGNNSSNNSSNGGDILDTGQSGAGALSAKAGGLMVAVVAGVVALL